MGKPITRRDFIDGIAATALAAAASPVRADVDPDEAS